MDNLPTEILQQVNEHLKHEDLLQCQITSQRWYFPATEELYRYVKIENIRDAQSFMVSVEENPILGTYVKKIHIESAGYNRCWNAEEFLDFIFTFCPYILGITFQPEYREDYWKKIVLARDQGKLKYIQTLQTPKEMPITIKYYSNACLSFRTSLQVLELRDQIRHSQGTNEDLTLYNEEFNALCINLQEFEELKKLVVYCHSNKGIAWLDGAIDRCFKLKQLSAFFVPYESQVFAFDYEYDISTIKQRPDIKIFKGHSSILEHGNSVLYVMHKFPQLDKLHITDDYFEVCTSIFLNESFGYNYSKITTTGAIMNNFFKYLSKIPSVAIECSLNMNMDVLVNFLEKHNVTKKKFIIQYSHNLRQEFSMDQFENTVKLSYLHHKCTETMSHSRFIEDAGHLISNLIVFGISDLQNILTEIAKESPRVTNNMYHGAWFTHILEHCPNLVNLELTEPGKIHLEDNTKLKSFPSVKSLTIHGVDNDILADLALILPSITYLYLLSRPQSSDSEDKAKRIVINMPNISFDKLAWEYVEYGWSTTNLHRAYIRIATPLGVYFFVTNPENESNIESSTDKDFLEAGTNDILEADTDTTSEDDTEDSPFNNYQAFLIDITCKSINILHIMRGSIDKPYHLNLGITTSDQ